MIGGEKIMKIFKSLLIVLALFALTSCAAAPPPPNPNTGAGNTQSAPVSRRSEGIDILGRAAYSAFSEETDAMRGTQIFVRDTDTAGAPDSAADAEEPGEYLQISYPYDYVKINAAKKYHVTIPDPATETASATVLNFCGLGDLDVVIADFTTYRYLEQEYGEQTDIEKLIPDITDTLISIKGTKGYYTILLNSYSFWENVTTFVFSSHKTISQGDVNKNLEPPIFGIKFAVYADGRGEISFSKTDGAAGFDDFGNASVYSLDCRDYEIMTRETLYSVLNLTRLPERRIGVQVIEVIAEKNLLKVTSDSTVEYVVLDEFTENMTGRAETLLDRYLEVSYDYLFEGYSPSVIYANAIYM